MFEINVWLATTAAAPRREHLFQGRGRTSSFVVLILVVLATVYTRDHGCRHFVGSSVRPTDRPTDRATIRLSEWLEAFKSYLLFWELASQ